MIQDVKRGLIPFYLHIALGTTSTASSDHLAELTPMKEKSVYFERLGRRELIESHHICRYGVWIHVDAAYAGSAWVVEKYRYLVWIAKINTVFIRAGTTLESNMRIRSISICTSSSSLQHRLHRSGKIISDTVNLSIMLDYRNHSLRSGQDIRRNTRISSASTLHISRRRVSDKKI